ncbi:MAG: hypothetical protein GY799_20900 [Desulfobulbaceae bacterium]|nr:hypothetical protein [Desulfobulbaceae bacterium]
MYIPKYFPLDELFPDGAKPRWESFDERILRSADALRETFGPLWCNGRGLTQCGFRTNGSETSQHRFGRAIDLHSDTVPYFEMRKFIINNPSKFPDIKFLEIDINWLHIDCRNGGELKLWSPKRGFVLKEGYINTGDI